MQRFRALNNNQPKEEEEEEEEDLVFAIRESLQETSKTKLVDNEKIQLRLENGYLQQLMDIKDKKLDVEKRKYSELESTFAEYKDSEDNRINKIKTEHKFEMRELYSNHHSAMELLRARENRRKGYSLSIADSECGREINTHLLSIVLDYLT